MECIVLIISVTSTKIQYEKMVIDFLWDIAVDLLTLFKELKFNNVHNAIDDTTCGGAYGRINK